MADLKRNGSAEVLTRLFPGMEVAPDAGYDVGIEFDCDRLPVDAKQLLSDLSELKRHVFGGPLDRAFRALQKKEVHIHVFSF